MDHLIVGEDITSLRDRGDIRVEKDFKFIDNVTSGNDMGKKYYNNHKMMLGMALSNLSGIEPSVSNNYIDNFLKYNNTSNSNNISNMVAESEKIKDSADLTKKEHMKLVALKEFLDNYNSNTSETSIKNKVDSPSKMMGLFNGKISPEEEGIYLMLFNTKLGLLGIEKITESEGNQMKINQKDILIKTLSYDVASVSLVHVNSSNKNKAFALGKDLSQNVFNMLGPLQLKNIDYLLINDNDYISLKEKGVMPYTVVGAAEYNNLTIMSEEVHNEAEYEEIEEEDECELEF